MKKEKKEETHTICRLLLFAIQRHDLSEIRSGSEQSVSIARGLIDMCSFDFNCMPTVEGAKENRDLGLIDPKRRHFNRFQIPIESQRTWKEDTRLHQLVHVVPTVANTPMRTWNEDTRLDQLDHIAPSIANMPMVIRPQLASRAFSSFLFTANYCIMVNISTVIWPQLASRAFSLFLYTANYIAS